MTMPRCNCAGAQCSCVITGGDGVEVSGTGSPSNPYVVTATGEIQSALIVNDTPTVNLTLLGSGTSLDPLVLSADATVALTDLTDVNDPAGPSSGDVPVWVTDHWEFQAPPTTPPGAVTTGAGLSGDGSGPSPLQVAVSGTWGSGPLSDMGADSTVGRPIYVDTNGQLRATPDRAVYTTSGVAIASSGWSLTQTIFARAGRMAMFYVDLTRTGASIAVGANGDIPNQTCFTVGADWQPRVPVGISGGAYGRGPNGYLSSTLASGRYPLILASFYPGTPIATGQPISVAGTYILNNVPAP